MKSMTQKKSTRTKTANRIPTQKTRPGKKTLGLSTSTGTRAGIGAGGY